METELVKKVVLLGDSAVGKTSLVRRYVYDQYDDEYISNIGAKVSKKVVTVDYKGSPVKVRLMIWDIIGSQGFESAQAKNIAGLDGAILVSDLTRPETFESLEKYWIPLCSEVTSDILPPMMFMGNKVDLIENIEKLDPFKEILETLESKYSGDGVKNLSENGKCWQFTSAKTGDHVEDGFKTLATLMVAAHHKFEPMAAMLDTVVADYIYVEKDRDSPKAIMDMIVTDFSHLVGSVESSRKILQDCIARLEFSKDDPSTEDLKQMIDCILKQAVDLKSQRTEGTSFRERVKEKDSLEDPTGALVEDYRKIWMEAIEGLEKG